MKQEQKEEQLKSRIREISQFYYYRGRMPSFSEIGELIGLKSKNAVSKLVKKLAKKLGLLLKPMGSPMFTGTAMRNA